MNKRHRIRYNSDYKVWQYYVEKTKDWIELYSWINYLAYREHHGLRTY